jgi:photosystem II stability/assembly factor-like uncharacterized protein
MKHRTKTALFVLIAAMLSGICSGQTWQPTSAPTNGLWLSAAASSNATKLVASYVDHFNGVGAIYSSTDSGATWTRVLSSTNVYNSVACSQDGVKVVVSWSWGDSGGVYTSTNLGATWARATGLPNIPFGPVSSSADGTKLVVGGDGIYVSTNSGASWSLTSALTNGWLSIAGSADERTLAAIPSDRSAIYVSLDSGASWCLDTWNASGRWQAVASSADGKKMVAVTLWPYGIWTWDYTSFNWQQTSAPLFHSWESVACSADGVGLVAVSGLGDGMICISTDSGGTWNCDIPFFDIVAQWLCVASSATGNRLLAGGMITPNQGSLYIYSTPAPLLSISHSGRGALLSWSAYPGGFFPEQTLDLNTDIWAPVTSHPFVVSNQNGILISSPVGRAFYRLSAR